VEERTSPEPQVDHVLEGDTARLTLTGELTEAARRPLVRVLTELLLHEHALAAVVLDVRSVSFMNSAGMAVLVQLLRMVAPRGVRMVLLDPSEAVRRPLQLSGLCRRFVVEDSAGEPGVAPTAGDGAS
jgi:stage II sporulation protein AA (anti-sigma F factor antagonist)